MTVFQPQIFDFLFQIAAAQTNVFLFTTTNIGTIFGLVDNGIAFASQPIVIHRKEAFSLRRIVANGALKRRVTVDTVSPGFFGLEIKILNGVEEFLSVEASQRVQSIVKHGYTAVCARDA